jgi:hypothetical protein
MEAFFRTFDHLHTSEDLLQCQTEPRGDIYNGHGVITHGTGRHRQKINLSEAFCCTQ